MSFRLYRAGLASVVVVLVSLSAAPASAQYPSENVSLLSRVSVQDFGAGFVEDSWGYTSVSGREYAIVGVSTGTAFVEITDPKNPVIVAIEAQSNRGRDMKVYQNYVYSSSDSGPTHIFDVSDIDNGVIVNAGTINAGTHNLAVDEVSGYLYLAIGGPMRAYDLADPANPVFVGTWPGQTHDAQVVTYTDGPYAGRQIAFVFAGWDHTVDIVDVTDKSNMFLVGQTGYANAGYTHQGWLSRDRQHLYFDDELDEVNGLPTTLTRIVDVSDLANPAVVGDFTTGEPATDHNLYVRGDFIFEANYASGMHVFDASDPLNPVRTGFFDTFPDNNNNGFNGAWNVYPFFPSGTVIVSDRSGGLFVLDVSDAVGTAVGDTNCDGEINAFDIEPFLLALFDPDQYPIQYPDCDINSADINGDGMIDAFDIEPFIGLLFP